MNTRTVLALALLCQVLASPPSARAQVYEKFYSFTQAREVTALASGGRGSGANSLVLGSDGYLYGTTQAGGSNTDGQIFGGGNGTAFRLSTSGVIETLVDFTNNGAGNKGRGSRSELIIGQDGNFYGTTYGGGTGGQGTVLKMTSTGTITTLASFPSSGAQGYLPAAGLVQGGDGNFYGANEFGGVSDYGTIYRITPGGAVTVLLSFSGNGASNKGGGVGASMVLGPDGNFYGTTQTGGNGTTGFTQTGLGTVFRMTPAGSLTTLVLFTDNGATNKGANPRCRLTLGSDGLFYGTTYAGGVGGHGTIFKMTLGGALTTLVEFTDSGPSNRGRRPTGGLIEGEGGEFFGTTNEGGAGGHGTVFCLSPSGQLTTIAEFTGAGEGPLRGRRPAASLTRGSDGNLYGVTQSGGLENNGTAFRVGFDGSVVTLADFSGDGLRGVGSNPPTGLIEDSPGQFVGMTSAGGSGDGTVFRVNSKGDVTQLARFTGTVAPTKGDAFFGGLVRGNDGSIYGTTYSGGGANLGTVFRLDPNGTFTTLVEFSGNTGSSKGSNPTDAMIQGSDGDFFGTTQNGGATGNGTVFRMTPAGVFTTLVEFSGNGASNKGSSPYAGLALGAGGELFGVTQFGGTSGLGTVFKMTTDGILTTLVNFTGNGSSNKGSVPSGRLALGMDGNFYGTTNAGGTSDNGTVFKVTPMGTLTTLVNFSNNGSSNKGKGPYAGLTLGTDGAFYGTTSDGGTGALGTLFKVTTGGTLTTLYEFGLDPTDSVPRGNLLRDSSGNLYGTTYGPSALIQGVTGYGSIFRLIFSGAPDVFPLGESFESSGALVTATINARGTGTSAVLEYGTDGTNFPNSIPMVANLTGYQTQLVGATITNLASGSMFYYRFRATSSAGQTLSAVRSFQAPTQPFAATTPPTEIAPTSARFNGTVNARGLETTVAFEWGTDGNIFPNFASAIPESATGTNNTPVSAAVAGLPAGGTVFYRLRATNQEGTAVSGVRSFSTVSVTTSNPLPEQVGVTEVVFRATVNTFGQTASVKFKYWADSAPGVVFETATQTVTSSGPTEVSARVTGLLENVAYSYRVSVELAGTETDGGAVGFTTDTNQPPSAVNDLVFYSGQVVVDPLANDSDPNDGSNVNLLLDPALVVAPDASRGVASVTNDRRGISYNPQFNVLDDDSLTYRVVDPLGASADGQVRLIAFSKRAGLYGGRILFGNGASAREGQVAVQMGGGGAISTSFMAWPSEGVGERESFVLKGVFDQRGRFTRTLNSPGGAVLTITLALDADAPRMLGTFEERVNEVSTTGEIAFVLTKDANTGGLAESGLRTGFLSPPSAQAGVMADGYLRMTVGKDARRGARFAGRLPDGEPFLTGARAQGRTYSLARALEQGGVFTGLVRAIDTSAGAGGMMGNLLWQKRASSRARYERGGVSSVLSLSGVAYPALERGALPPLGANVRLILGGVRRSDGSAVSYRDLLMQLVPGSMVAQIVGSDPAQATGEDIPLTKLQVKVDAVNAAFRGRFLHPATGRTVPFDGALRMPFDGEPVQGRGVFRGPGAAGSVRLEAD